jgi:putative peptidoglycan lipid II flippase
LETTHPVRRTSPSVRFSFLPTISKSAAVTVATIAGQAPGFVFPLLVATLFGATPRTDAFFIAFAAATFVLNALSGATQHAIVPYVVELDNRRAGPFAASALGFTLLSTLVGMALLFGASILLPRQLGGHGSLVLLSLCSLVPFTFLASTANLWVGVLNARQRYVVAALSPAVRWLPLLAIIWAFGRDLGFRVVPIGYAVGETVRIYVLYRAVRTTLGPEFKSWAWPSRELAPFMRTGTAQIIGSAVIALLPLVDRVMAVRLSSGSVSLLDYAERIWQAPVGLMMSGFLIVSLAIWSQEHGGETSTDVLRRRTLYSALTLFVLSVLPITALMVYRQVVVAALFARSGLPADEIVRLADTLGAYMVGVPVYLMGLTYARAYLVIRRSDWLLGVSVVQFAVKCLLNAILMRRFGLPGIALATSAIYALGSIVLIVALHSGLVNQRTMIASRTPPQ